MSTKKSVLITGCSDGGLGAALAVAFHKKGYRVIATARNVAKMASLKRNGIELVTLDVQSEDSIRNCVQEVSKLLNHKLDILVNNAGAGYSMPILDIELDEIRKLFDLNVFSLISVSRAFFPLIREAGGMIVNNTSIAGTIHGGVPMQSAYNSTKAAATILTNNLRLELEPFGVKVVDLKTGAVKTNFFANVGSTDLPSDSIYLPAKDAIVKFMGGDELMKGAMSADDWAGRVVRDLTSSSPPYMVWRGAKSTLLWFASFFPVHWLDSQVRPLVGLVELEKRLKVQK